MLQKLILKDLKIKKRVFYTRGILKIQEFDISLPGHSFQSTPQTPAVDLYLTKLSGFT